MRACLCRKPLVAMLVACSLCLAGCSLSRADRIELGCATLLAVAEPVTAIGVRELEDDELIGLGAALDRVSDGVDRVNAIVQAEIDERQLGR